MRKLPDRNLPILFADIDGCLRPTGNGYFMKQLDGESYPLPEDHRWVTVRHPIKAGVTIKFDGKPVSTGPGIHTDTFHVGHHVVEFMREAHKWFDCHFSSWWSPASSRALCEAVGIEPWPALEPGPFINHQDVSNFDHAKWNMVKAHHNGRPFVWVDDCEILRAAHDWAIDLDVPTLCIIPDHAEGITVEHVAMMKEFARQVSEEAA